GGDRDIPGRPAGAANSHIGIAWPSSVAFGHVTRLGKRVIVLGGGNTAMDCCRTSRRLGGDDVKVIVRSGFDEMKASPWEKEDATHEGIPILNFLVPKSFVIQNQKLAGMTFEKVKAVYDAQGKRSLVKMEVELGFDVATAWKEAQRCLNCDVQTVFTDRLCIECDACVDICPMDCISFVPNADEKDLRNTLSAPAKNETQDLYVSGPLK